MIWAAAVAIWCTLFVGARLASSRDLFRAALGLALLGSAVNLVIFASGRLFSDRPAIVPAGETVLGEAADSVPQALVLTAIVIGFAFACFAFVLVLRIVRDAGTDHVDELRFAEPRPVDPVQPPPEAPGCGPVHPGPAGDGGGR